MQQGQNLVVDNKIMMLDRRKKILDVTYNFFIVTKNYSALKPVVVSNNKEPNCSNPTVPTIVITWNSIVQIQWL